MSILIVYTNGTILMGPSEKELENIIKLLQSKFKVQSKGHLSNYLWILIKKEKDPSMNLTQPQFIKSIIEDFKLTTIDAKGKTSPALSSKILGSDLGEPRFDNSFNYRGVIGKLLYLEK